MIQITDNCKGCGICLPNCPQKAISIQNKRATISIECSECGICTRVCPTHAAVKIANTGKEGVVCAFCPVQCTIKPGFTGACKRFTNVDGTLMRNRKLVFENQLEHYESDYAKPLITASGAGSTYPCCRPAPHIVSALRDGVDMVTVVTEAPLSYSGVTVKIDTNAYLGETGDAVYRDGKKVGILSTEEYGSKMLSIGGAGLLTSKDGFIVARTIVELANGEEVSLKLQQKTTLVIQNNHAPIVDGIPQKKMRVGCGSATVGLFAETMKQAADDVIVIDHHIIGLLSEHLAGAEVGLSWSGIVVNG
ncbi:DUF362 domain-containing protein [Hespellia stercorisuis]|uniref:4Fe-4S dicluster domain-containing protein n=1 Tax=Hespellia stercorisuis DSM 15480 TaxID=1121950 RepID=A0A1M6VE33_9FIRM|nr:4Fe-4S dicluster domain-containing protein [Hespellia stercorisuis]SHK79807.1 4Fe-4S dicluster domain-containing protein [Hespellia stercorisuis DSM 15480]